MGLFTRRPKPAKPSDVGFFLATYINTRLLEKESARQLRDLAVDEGVPEAKRVGFNNNLFLLSLFVAFVAAKRQHGVALAKEVLWAAVAPMLAPSDSAVARHVRDRLQHYESVSNGLETPAQELAVLVRCACKDLYDDDGEDAIFVAAVTIWIHAHLKAFDQFFADMEFAR